MKARDAAAGSAAFFALAPGVVAGVMPWALTGWRAAPAPAALKAAGAALTLAGAAVLVAEFARFAREGRGTPAPAAPTERLVVGGLYRYVRNPMYLAVLAAIAGQALLLARPVLALYGLVVAATVVTFVRGYEEPALAQQFGPEYAAYRRAVPGWWPLRRRSRRRR
jgi:protein-S-isoprenylcysteine O-methyltransferase Ste14